MAFTDKIASTFKKADSKLGESYDVGKYKLMISDERSAINKNYYAIGEQYYKMKKGDDFDQAAIDAAIAAIDECNARIDEYNGKIEKAKKTGSEERATM